MAQFKILPPTVVGSAFLNKTPLVAMMVPVIRDINRTPGLAASKLFIPLSFSSILGGASTLIGTSTNLIIAGLVADYIASGALSGMDPIGIFEPTLIGLPAGIVGIIFIMLIGTRLLPKPAEKAVKAEAKRLYAAEFIVEKGSPLVGTTLEAAGFDSAIGYELVHLDPARLPQPTPAPEPAQEAAPSEQVAPKLGLLQRVFHWFERLLGFVRRAKKPKAEEPDEPEVFKITPSYKLQAGDSLRFSTDIDNLPGLWATIGLTPRFAPVSMETERYEHQLVEVVVAARNPTVERLIKELPVRDPPPFEAKVVAVSREGRAPEGSLEDFGIQAGDNAVLEVADDFFYEARGETEFALTRPLEGYRLQRVSRAVVASVITLAMVLLAAFNVMSMLNAALLAGAAVLFTGSLTVRRAWGSIEWETLVPGDAVGLSAAVTETGLSDAIADALAVIGGDSAFVALTVVFIGVITMTNVITNAAAASLIFPVAVALANIHQRRKTKRNRPAFCAGSSGAG